MKAKRLLSLLLTACMLAGMLQLGVSAEATSGTCGENLTWVLEGDTLTISGTGPMYDYSGADAAPWYQYRESIKRIIIQQGVTKIGKNAFEIAIEHAHVVIANTVQTIESKAFFNSKYTHYWFMGEPPTIAEDAFDDAFGVGLCVQDWDSSLQQGYGGRLNWYKCELLWGTDSKRLYKPNEPIQPSDIVLKAKSPFNDQQVYTPINVQIGSYDNTEYGFKSVDITVDGYTLTHEYFVTDGNHHLNAVQVHAPKYQYFDPDGNMPKPTVTADGYTLVEGLDYRLAYSNNTQVTTEATIKVIGMGIFESYESVTTFEILKQNMEDIRLHLSGRYYSYKGEPLYPKLDLYTGNNTIGVALKEDSDYALLYEDNVNKGKGSIYIVGLGNYFGFATKALNIQLATHHPILKGAYNGLATGELNEEMHVEELVIPAGKFCGSVDSAKNNIAYYELYRVNGEELELIKTQETKLGASHSHQFEYDFSYVYDLENEMNGEIYILNYSWVDTSYAVYSGMMVIGVYGKTPEATQVTINQLENDEDFRRDYLSMAGEDGNLGPVSWTSSDESTATVKNGQVTFKKPGTVTITGSNASGTLSASKSLTAQQQDLSQANILGYDAESGTVDITYQSFLLTPGVDYVVDIAEQAGKTVVTASGKGLFAGQIVREFTETDEPVAHTHSFDNCEDLTCATCTYQRTQAHAYDEKWNKSETEHWHACKLCGQDKDRGEHILSADNDKLCQTCGQLYMVGDVDDDGEVTDWDGVLLARYLAGWPVDVPIAAALDVDGDGEVTDWDGVIMDRYLAGWNVTIG